MAPRSILIAATNPGDRLLLKEIFLQLDPRSTVSFALSTTNVLDILQKSRLAAFPDLIVMDCELPGMSTEEILNQISRIPAAELILRVIWSGTMDKERWLCCHTLGAHLMLSKTSLPSDVKMALANLMLSFPRQLCL